MLRPADESYCLPRLQGKILPVGVEKRELRRLDPYFGLIIPCENLSSCMEIYQVWYTVALAVDTGDHRV